MTEDNPWRRPVAPPRPTPSSRPTEYRDPPGGASEGSGKRPPPKEARTLSAATDSAVQALLDELDRREVEREKVSRDLELESLRARVRNAEAGQTKFMRRSQINGRLAYLGGAAFAGALVFLVRELVTPDVPSPVAAAVEEAAHKSEETAAKVDEHAADHEAQRKAIEGLQRDVGRLGSEQAREAEWLEGALEALAHRRPIPHRSTGRTDNVPRDPR